MAEPEKEEESEKPEPTRTREPLDLFAEAAGYTDHELWWEHQIERHHDAAGLFDAIREAMHAVRGDGDPRD